MITQFNVIDHNRHELAGDHHLPHRLMLAADARTEHHQRDDFALTNGEAFKGVHILIHPDVALCRNYTAHRAEQEYRAGREIFATFRIYIGSSIYAEASDTADNWAGLVQNAPITSALFIDVNREHPLMSDKGIFAMLALHAAETPTLVFMTADGEHQPESLRSFATIHRLSATDDGLLDTATEPGGRQTFYHVHKTEMMQSSLLLTRGNHPPQFQSADKATSRKIPEFHPDEQPGRMDVIRRRDRFQNEELQRIIDRYIRGIFPTQRTGKTR